MKHAIMTLFLLALFVMPAYSSGLSVTPSKIDQSIVAGNKITVDFVIANPTQDVSVIEVYPDDFERNIAVDTKSFTLEAQEEQTVSVSILFEEPGVYGTFLSVVSKSLGDRTFRARSGIKIPLDISVESEATREYNWPLYGIIVFDVVLLVVLAVLIGKRIQKRKRKNR